MAEQAIESEVFMLQSEGLSLRVFLARPAAGAGPYPVVQIHHAGGGYEPIYEHMAEELASRNMIGVTLINRGYPGSQGEMEYGKGEVLDIGNLSAEILSRADTDPQRMFIMGYSRGAHNALLAVERYDYFRAAALWSVPVDMVDHVRVHPWIAGMVGGMPEEVPQEYHIRSSINFVEQIDCPLLLLHGENDDVIPVRHARRLAEALARLKKPCECQIFPGEWHVWSMRGFAHNWRLTLDFIERHLDLPPERTV